MYMYIYTHAHIEAWTRRNRAHGHGLKDAIVDCNLPQEVIGAWCKFKEVLIEEFIDMRHRHEQRAALWFNDELNYKGVLLEAVDLKRYCQVCVHTHLAQGIESI